MSQHAIEPLDFEEEYDLTHSDSVEPESNPTKPTKSKKKESDTMNQINQTQQSIEKLSQKEVKLLEFYIEECLRYLELDEASTTAPRRGRGAVQPTEEKSPMLQRLSQLKKVSEKLRENYITNLER